MRLPDDASSLRRSHYTLFLLCGMAAFNAGDRQLLSIMIEPIKHDLGITDTGIGVLTGVGFALCYFIAGIPLAMWADRGLRRNVVAFCLTVWSVMTAISGLTQNFAQMAAARAGVAIGEAGGNPASHSMIMDLFPPQRRATAIAIFIASQSAGIAGGLALAGWLSSLFSWRAVFIICGVPGILWALVILLTVKEPPRGSGEPRPGIQEPILRSIAELWKLKSMRIMLVMAMFGSFNGYAILAWSPAFFLRVHDLTAAELAPRIGLATATGLILGNYLSGRISDALASRDLRWYMRVSGFGSLLAVPFLLVFLFSPDLNLALIGLSGTQLLLTTFMPPLFTVSLTLAPARLRATTSMMMGMALYVVGLSFGPLVIGMLNDHWTPTFGQMAVRFSLLIEIFTLTICGLLCLLANRWIVADAERAKARNAIC